MELLTVCSVNNHISAIINSSFLSKSDWIERDLAHLPPNLVLLAKIHQKNVYASSHCKWNYQLSGLIEKKTKDVAST